MYSVIRVSPTQVWDYATHLKEFNKSYIIAYNKQYGVEISVSKVSNNQIEVCVEVDNQIEDYLDVVNKNVCEKRVQKIYDTYLNGNFAFDIFEGEAFPDTPEEDMYADEIERRENELEDSLRDFLSVVIEADYDLISEEVLEDIKDDILSYLAMKRKFEIYRPTIIEENGTEICVDYPYDIVSSDEKKDESKSKESSAVNTP